MGDAIRINNNRVSWGSISVKFNGDLFVGFTALSYSDKRERELSYGMGRHQAPMGRSRGKYTPDNCKLTGFKRTVQDLRAALAAASPIPDSYGDSEVQIVANYVELDESPICVEINRCVWVSSSSSESEGTENIKEEIEWQPLYIRRNGLVLFDTTGFAA